MNSFRITNSTAPGTPNMPTKIAVAKLSPIWNEKLLPIKFIKYIKIPPNTEFITSFNIFIKGTANILPIITKPIMHAKYI